MKETSNRVRNVQYFTIVLFIVGGGLIGSAAYVSFIPPNTRTILKVGMVAIGLAAWLVLSRSERLRQYRQIALSLFAVSLGVLLAQYCGSIPMSLLGFSVTTVQGVAMAKFGEALPIVGISCRSQSLDSV